MRHLLGLPLEAVRELLVRDGYEVRLVEARSRKGVEGDSLRVIRLRELGDSPVPTIELVYSEFKTVVSTEEVN